jgi:uncharacterized membrane protein
MTVRGSIEHALEASELELLRRLRRTRRQHRLERRLGQPIGQRVADGVALLIGSWRFILIQSGLLLLWMALNALPGTAHWDPYPFILLNLALSFQAAYTAPVIMMSQNRQQAIDRASAETDYQVNVKAELEIELLHQKIDQLREREVMALIDLVGRLEQRLALLAPPAPVPEAEGS